MARIRKAVPGVDPKLLVKDAAKLLPDQSRRLFLRGAASLGAISMLTGCDIVDSNAAEDALMAISRFNDRVQALLFNPNRLRPIRKARSPGRSRSTPTTTRTRRPRSMARPTSSRWAGSWTRRSRGR